MSIIPGTFVELPNGRKGIVIPSSLWRPDRVLVKVQKGGRKHWFKIDECVPIPLTYQDEMIAGIEMRMVVPAVSSD